MYRPKSPGCFWIAHTPKKHIHEQKKKKRKRNLTVPTKNSLIDSSNIIYKVPGEHHKCQLTNLEKTAPHPPEIQCFIKKKEDQLVLIRTWSVYINQDVYRTEKCFSPYRLLLKSPLRLFFVVKKLFIFFHLWNIERQHKAESESAHWLIPQRSL